MAERPILYSAPMVRAVLDSRKTVTRRVVKPQPVETLYLTHSGFSAWHNEKGRPLRNPYGHPGDRLWVRETFFAWGRWETRHSPKKVRDEWHFIDMTVECGKDYLYSADGVSDTGSFVKRRGGIAPMYWKRPAIFMPRIASRITLEVTGVRVERLQDISEDQAEAEGCAAIDGYKWHTSADAAAGIPMHDHTARDAFGGLWEAINGDGSWDANPWVWVVEFKRVQS